MNIRPPKKTKQPDPYELPPFFFNLGGETLVKAVTSLIRNNWNKKCISLPSGESLNVSTFNKGTRSDCRNHSGVTLIPIFTRVLASVTLRRMTPIREITIREQRALISSKSKLHEPDIHSSAASGSAPHIPPVYDLSPS